MNSEWWISSFIILEFSLPRKAEKRYRCTLFIHTPIELLHTEHSHWLLRHWTQRALKGHNMILLCPPVVLIWTPLKLLWIQYELSWVQLLQEKECTENLDPSQWCIYLKVWSQCFWAWTLQSSVNISFLFFFILNTLLNWFAIATPFIPNSFRNRFG